MPITITWKQSPPAKPTITIEGLTPHEYETLNAALFEVSDSDAEWTDRQAKFYKLWLALPDLRLFKKDPQP